MKVHRLVLHFADEGWPKIGSGKRLVDVQIGRKWVYMKEVHAHDQGRKRFPRATACDRWPELNTMED